MAFVHLLKNLFVAGFFAAFFSTISLFGQEMIIPQEFAIPGFPEELMPPPEPLPATIRRFEYIGYAQTSQGPLQDDPIDQDLLAIRQGWTSLSDVYSPAEGSFGFQVPTFEALIDMVVGRDSYLLGATPYDRAAPFNLNAILGHIRTITFDYISDYSEYSNLTPVVRIYNNGTRVGQIILSDVPIRNSGNGLNFGRAEKVQIKLNSDGNNYSIDTHFKLANPGNYLVRVELMERVPNPAGPNDYLRSGIAVDVYGKVVKTKTPSVTMVSIHSTIATPSQRSQLVSSVKEASIYVKDGLKTLLPSDNNIQNYPVTVSNFSTDGGQFNDLYQMAQVYLRAKRFSDPNFQSDRIVAVVEWDLYNELLNRGNISTHPVFLCSAGFNWGKHFIAIPGDELYLPETRPFLKSVQVDAVHEIFHTLSNVPWAPIEGKMGDCKIPPFHDVSSAGASAGVAFGLVNFPGPPSSLMSGFRCIMQKNSSINNISQCTYRHALEILSKSEIDPPVLVVGGMAIRNGISNSASLNPLYQMDGFYELDENGSGDWHIVLKDGLGNVLGDYPFDPMFQFGGQLYESMPFNYTVPDVPGVRRVEITGPVAAIGGPIQLVMDGIDYSTFPPVIWDLVADKTPGQIEVRWAAYDFDDDPLLYTLLASEDGFTYLPTPVSEASETETVFEVPDTVSHVKLVVTDGSRSASRVLEL